MKREIKFRAWDNVDYMSSPFSLMDIQIGKIQFTSTVHIMQFTGLKDMEGKDIYEGDIVNGEKIMRSPNYIGDNPRVKEFIGIIEYSGTGFRVRFLNQTIINRFGGNTNTWLTYDVTVKVIGNIFENPELLNP